MEIKTFYQNKKVLVTGHTGFKGAWLTQWLIELGAEVIGVALDDTDNTQLFEELGLINKVKHYHCDINDLDKVKEIFLNHKPDVVFHLAAQAIVKTSYEDPIETLKTNIIGTANILESIRNVDSVLSAVLVTSDKCYKNEEKKFGFKESDAMGGDDPYSASKACAELVIHSYRHSFFKDSKTKLVSVRAGNILGGGDWSRDRIVVDAIRSIQANQPIFLRDPSAVRPWQHVLDATYGYLTAAIYAIDETKEVVTSWNFGPSEAEVLTVEELVQLIISNYGKGSYENLGERKYHEANYLKLNVELAKNKLDWKLLYNNNMIVEKTISWYISYEKGIPADVITNDQINEYMNMIQNK
jgi:CDP-glucose 4,6-dehydratase